MESIASKQPELLSPYLSYYLDIMLWYTLIPCISWLPNQALMESIASKQPELLSPYLHNLERCVLWAETNVAEEMLPNECDQETNR